MGRAYLANGGRSVRIAFMLIPQYSIRLLLLITAGCAVVFSIFGLAVQGNAAAVGVSLAIAGLAVVLLAHAATFGLVWLFSVIGEPFRRKPAIAGRSPFKPGAASSCPGESAPIDEKDIPAAPVILE